MLHYYIIIYAVLVRIYIKIVKQLAGIDDKNLVSNSYFKNNDVEKNLIKLIFLSHLNLEANTFKYF